MTTLQPSILAQLDAERRAGRFNPSAYLEWLSDQARQLTLTAQTGPAYDTATLIEQFTTDHETAYALLADLSATQLASQAAAMASFAQGVLGRDWQSEDVLTRWRGALARRRERCQLGSS